MSDSGGNVGAGWLHAEGDPPGTQRYWDGTAWQGEPQPVPQAAPAPPPTPPPAFAPPPAMGTPAMGQPGPHGGFDEPKKKRSVLKWVLGISLVLLLGIGGCSYAVFRAVSGPIDVGNEFLAAVQERDFERAWDLSDASCFEGGGEAQLAQIFGNDTITSYNLSQTNVNSSNGVTTGSTSGTVTLAGDDVRSIEIVARKSGDEWLVCGFDIAGPGG